MVSIETRRRYAEDVRKAANITSEALVEAFASVPREDFAGPSPWKIYGKPEDVADASELYRDVAVVLDAERSLTNGNPGALGAWIDALKLAKGGSVFHLGCGAGYYTAILAEVVGPEGRVTAAEIDPVLAGQARASLARYPNVEVIEGDGGAIDTGARDAILVNAGVTHPAEKWLDNLAMGGTLLVPITIEFGRANLGKGMVLVVSRMDAGYTARFLPMPVVIYSCRSMRDAEMERLFGQRFLSGTVGSVRALRRERHEQGPACWLHMDGFCLTT